MRTPHDLGRLDEAVLAFDAETRDHVRAVAARGAALGRKPRSFGLVGDSMTAAPYFLHGFAATAGEPVVHSAAVAARLRTTVDGVPDRTIVDYFRGADVQLGIDAFGARRAAKVGARTEWALSPPSQPTLSPLGNLVARISPSVVLVMYGTNDAGTRFVALDELTARFEQELLRIVDFVEAAGIVPVLSTLPRHTDDAGRRDCSSEPDDMTDWRLAVQTTAVSAAAARLACRRHLPLIDLRWALEGLPNHGIGEDGVHPTNFAGGSAVLDEHGLACGYNVRSYLALGMLKALKEELERPGARPGPDPSHAPTPP
ncbi:MAG: hypothetical protein HY908_14005 [Myxococcales bacterium]|nr:hypothetical protein [Myxococcales bacterium]